MAQKIQYHWQLDVYQLSVEAAMEIYELSKAFPKEEVYSLTDRIKRVTTISFSGFLQFSLCPSCHKGSIGTNGFL